MSDLVVISLEAWDEVWRRNQHLVAGLLRADPNLRVLFVEPAIDTTHALATTHRLRQGRGLRPGPATSGVRPGQLLLLEPTKALPRRLDRRYDRRWAGQVRRAARRAGLDRPVLWVNDTMGAELLDAGWPTLYDLTDDWLAADRPPGEHARLVRQEGALLAAAEVVVACSPALVRSKGAGREIALVQNAVDLAAYRDAGPRPAAYPEGPVAAYVGTLHTDRLDVDLCAATARALGPEATLVLVGPDLLDARDRERVRSAGALLLGAVPADQVPGHLVHADVLVVPHIVDDFTASLDPIKRYEYAAAARPVVATPVPGFTDPVSAADFPDAVRRAALGQTGPRSAPGPAVDWSSRVAAMRDLLEAARP